MAWEDLAKRHGLEEFPFKIGLITSTAFQDPPITIALLLVLEDEMLVIGTSHPDDIWRTAFDRFTGLALDNGGLSKHFIPASELQRIERNAAKGTYDKIKPGAVTAISSPATGGEEPPFDPDQAM